MLPISSSPPEIASTRRLEETKTTLGLNLVHLKEPEGLVNQLGQTYSQNSVAEEVMPVWLVLSKVLFPVESSKQSSERMMKTTQQ